MFHKFSKSTTYLATESLPQAHEIAQMKSHNHLLNMIKAYFDKEGNAFEKLLFLPGIKGYKKPV